MARIVEICGSPGVGKSTIFYDIQKKHRTGDKWIISNNSRPKGDESRSEFFKRIFRHIKDGRKFIGRTKQRENYFTPFQRAFRTAKLGRNFVDQVWLKEAGDRFIAQHPEYIDACWKNILMRQAKSRNGLDLRFEKAEFIYRIIKKVQVLKEDLTNKSFIIDEGLINMIDRALWKSTTPDEEEVEIEELINVMPLPDAVVYLHTDLQENAMRLISRRDLRDMHRGLDKEELIEMTSLCRNRILTAINCLKERNIPVLVLDTTAPVQQTSKEIIAFASGIEKNSSVLVPGKAIVA